MARNKLSEARLRALTVPGIYGDGDGLYLRVHRARGAQADGSKNWIFIYRRGTKRHEIGLGGYGQGTAPVSLKVAREKAEAIRDALARGEDPMADRAPKGTTFGQCMESVLAIKAQEAKNAKHLAQWEMTLRRYAEPLHALPVAKVTRDDVLKVLEPHWTERPETADRLRSRIAAVLDYAKARGLREGDNPAQWRGGLKSLLPAQDKLSRGHHAALEYHAVPAMMANLRKAAGVSARTVEFIALTAARAGEAAGAIWSEIDLDSAVWIVPASRMKAGEEHRVPLSRRAVEILQGQRQRRTGELVFGGGKDDRPISNTAMTKALRRAAEDEIPTLHGLRSSFRDWAGDATIHPRDVCEAALAHKIQGVEAAYRRKDALDKRRSLMDDWADYCASAHK